MAKPIKQKETVQSIFVQMTRCMGSCEISDMLQIDPKLSRKNCALWLVENAYNQLGHLTEQLSKNELGQLEKMLLKEAKIIAADAL